MSVQERERDVAPAPPTLPAPGRRSVLRREAVVLGAFVALAVLLFRGAWADPAHRLIGAPGDPLLFVWYLRWVPWAISHGHNPLFSSYVNAPHGMNLMWNTAVLLLSVLFAPLTAWLGPMITYNVLATAGVAVSGWTASLVFRRVGRLGWGAYLGGLLFAFSPFLVSQSLGHLHLTTVFLLPVLALAAHEVAVVQQWSPFRGGLVLGALAAAQALIGEEVLAIAAVGLLAAALIGAGLDRRGAVARLRHVGRALPWSAGAFVVLAGGPLLFQFAGSQAIHGPVQPRDFYVADLWAPVVATRFQWWHPFAAIGHDFQSRGAEWSAFLGVPVLVIVAAVVVAQRRKRGVLVAGLTLVAVVLFSFGPHLHVDGHRTVIPMPWLLVGWIPPLDSVLPVRLMLDADFIAAGLVGLALESAWRARSFLPRVLAAAGGGLMLATLFPNPMFDWSTPVVPAFFSSRSVRDIAPGSLVAIAPYPSPPNVMTMAWQVAARFRYRSFGAYALVPGADGRPSFTGPPTALGLVLASVQSGSAPDALDFQSLIAARQELLANHVSVAIVGPMANQTRAVALFTTLMGHGPRFEDGVYLWTGGVTGA